MMYSTVRLSGITLENFKSVSFGHIAFRPRDVQGASLLGLYGQNGSGKTALINALELVKRAMSGDKIPGGFAHCISKNKNSAKITCDFEIKDNATISNVTYVLQIRRRESALDNPQSVEIATEVISESLFCGIRDIEGKVLFPKTKTIYFDEKTSLIEPAAKEKLLFGSKVNELDSLKKLRILTQFDSRSFVFANAFYLALKNRLDNESAKGNMSEDNLQLLQRIVGIIERLAIYAQSELFTLSTRNNGLLTLNILPMVFSLKEDGVTHPRTVGLLIDQPTPLPVEAIKPLSDVMNKANEVLKNLIPGLHVDIKSLGKNADANGQPQEFIELFSVRNDLQIPLRYESEGIKKLISVLSLLIEVYNNPSVTVAIDELDSGIFEYLLGEILKIIEDQGKGQLIFTSHNLRPLEILRPSSLAFSTTNPKNRYIRMKNLNANNNTRSVFYRNILLDDQEERLYEPTSDIDISMALRRAGRQHG